VDTEGLPELPAGWCWALFGELCDTISGGTTTPPVSKRTRFAVLRSSSVRVGNVDYTEVRFLPDEKGPVEEKVVENGDLLFTRLSGSIEYVANCACVRDLKGSWLAYPDRLFCAKLVDQRIAEFSELVFATPFIHRALTSQDKSTAGQQRISISNLASQPTPLPSFDEQAEIVARARALLHSQARLSMAMATAGSRLTGLDQSVLAKAFRGELVDPTDD
jgi:type I restriction enzyme S subunit